MSHQVHVILTTFCLSVQDWWNLGERGVGDIEEDCVKFLWPSLNILTLYRENRTKIDNLLHNVAI